MAFDFLRKMSGTEVKLFLILLTYSDKHHEYINMETLMDFDLSYPTIMKTIDDLIHRNCIKKIDTGNICIIRIAPEYQDLASYLKKCPDQLTLFPEDVESETPKKWWTKKDQDIVIRHYAIELGVPTDKISEWYKSGNYTKNIRGAQRLLEYCTNLEQAKRAITNCRIDRSRQGLEWSLGGDVNRNIQKYVQHKVGLSGEKKWH